MELRPWQGLWTGRVKPQHLATLCAKATLQTISNVTVEDTCIAFDKALVGQLSTDPQGFDMKKACTHWPHTT